MNSMAIVWLIWQYRHITIIESTKTHLFFITGWRWRRLVSNRFGIESLCDRMAAMMSFRKSNRCRQLMLFPLIPAYSYNLRNPTFDGNYTLVGDMPTGKHHARISTKKLFVFISWCHLHHYIYCRINVHLRLPNNTWYVNIKCAYRATGLVTVSFDLIIIYKFHILTHGNLHRTRNNEQLNGVLFNAFTPKMVLCEEKFNRILDARHQCDENLCGMCVWWHIVKSHCEPLRP